jgi:hypothetical protein
MKSATFVGEVHDGRLHIQEPLADFEGERVLVTLIAADAKLLHNAVTVPRAASEAEILEDPGRVRRPARAAKTMSAQIISIGRRLPPQVTED